MCDRCGLVNKIQEKGLLALYRYILRKSYEQM